MPLKWFKKNQKKVGGQTKTSTRQTMWQNLLLGLLLSMGIAGAAYAKQALSKSGVLGAILVGTLIFGLGGWVWGLVLITFFVASSGLSRFKDREKAAAAEKFDKGHQRDFWQAIANGGPGALMALGAVVWPSELWWFAFLGAIATATADTWATELGVLSRSTPRLITSGAKVAPGTSGGITLVGTLAAFSGAAFIGLAGWGFSWAFALSTAPVSLAANVVTASLGGLGGAMVDSLLGATVQLLYVCPVCGTDTEQAHHRVCGSTPTEYLRGWQWLNNDAVNLVSSFAGAGLAVLLAMGLGLG
jgi:uncharacterized protein (TIGR00297 family)